MTFSSVKLLRLPVGDDIFVVGIMPFAKFFPVVFSITFISFHALVVERFDPFDQSRIYLILLEDIVSGFSVCSPFQTFTSIFTLFHSLSTTPMIVFQFDTPLIST